MFYNQSPDKYDHYWDNHFLQKQRTNYRKGYKRYKERQHLYYEFKLFYLTNGMVKEWEKFRKDFIAEDKRLREIKRIEKRNNLEANVFEILWDKERIVSELLFEEQSKEVLRKRIKAMEDKKLRKVVKDTKKKQQTKTTVKDKVSLSSAILHSKKPSPKHYFNQAYDILEDSSDAMFPNLSDYTEAQFLLQYWSCNSNYGRLTEQRINKFWKIAQSKDNPIYFVEAILKVVETHKKYNKAKCVLDQIEAQYPDLFFNQINPKDYYIYTGIKLKTYQDDDSTAR